MTDLSDLLDDLLVPVQQGLAGREHPRLALALELGLGGLSLGPGRGLGGQLGLGQTDQVRPVLQGLKGSGWSQISTD